MLATVSHAKFRGLISITILVFAISIFAESTPDEAKSSDRGASTPPVELTTQEDHKRLHGLLGIKELRRRANGNDPKAPNAANYDESKVNPDLKLPDPLVLKNGDLLPDVLDLFDFAEPSLVTGDRETTNVLVQALYLINSSFVQSRATALANRVLREADNHEQRLRHAFVHCFSRAPDAEESKLAAAFFEPAKNLTAEQYQQHFVSYCQALLATTEFRNLD